MVDLKGLRIDSFQCRNHPEREGVGVCVSCRRVICIECSTKIEGVNHCRECLAKRGATVAADARPRAGLAKRGTSLALALVIVGASVALSTVAIGGYGEMRARGGQTRVANMSRMREVAAALRHYKRDTGSFPPSASGNESLLALVKKPEGVKSWRGPYLDLPPSSLTKAIPDGYGEPVHYWLDPKGVTCVIGSAGPDRFFESTVENAKKLAFSTEGEAEAQGDDIVLVVD